MMYVIGSGPAGVSCAMALLSRGVPVTMLDAGVELEIEKQHILEEFQETQNETLLNKLKDQAIINDFVKSSHGSYYPYADVENHITVEADKKIQCMLSFAKGGLSNVWGAFVAQYKEADLTTWPIKLEDLAPHYQKILKLLSPAKAKESHSSDNYYEHSAQATKLLTHMKLHKAQLSQAGFSFESAELAVKFREKGGQCCQYCGICHHGCPYDLIYSARHTLNELLKNPQFTYIKNIVVKDIQEDDHQIILSACNRITHEKITFEASQVFLGCGSIISTLLILKSMKAYDHKIRFLDSSSFILPCLMKGPVKQVAQERLHTLCQLQLKLTHSGITSRPMHLQLYTYMKDYMEKIQKLTLNGHFFPNRVLDPIINRLVVFIGFLDSNDSHGFDMEISNNDNILLTPHLNSSVRDNIKNILSYLKAHRHYLGISPVKSMMKMSKIGKSAHYGGSLPMRQSPKPFETDIFGKPFGHKRLHVIDASIFPSISADSITPTIMANAHRIGAECEIL